MTKDKDEKAVIRARMARTGEAYAAARAQLARKEPALIPEGIRERLTEAFGAGQSIVLTKEAARVFKDGGAYPSTAWELLLALRGTDGVAAAVLRELGMAKGRPLAEEPRKDIAPAKLWIQLVIKARELVTAQGRKSVDTGSLLRAAVDALDEAEVPAEHRALAMRLRSADLQTLCAEAEAQHGSESGDGNDNERTGMFERFTDKARMVVVAAQEEARRLDHNWIGTEHILLGLLRIEDAIAAKVLTSLGVNLAQTRAEVEAIIGRGDEPPSGHIPFTPRAKSTLEQSLRAALEMNHNYIGTEHLLLGLLAVGECVATAVLLKHEGLTLESVRAKVIEALQDLTKPKDD